jgi:hypothetical protein
MNIRCGVHVGGQKQGDQIGLIFASCFLKIIEVAQNFMLLFWTAILKIILMHNGLGFIFADFFHKLNWSHWQRGRRQTKNV